MNYKFSYINFFVKERETEQPLITGQYKGDFFYVLHNLLELHFSYCFKTSSIKVWHQRLEHL